MNDQKKLTDEQTEAPETAEEIYADMPKGKAALLKCLPLIITLTCVGLFALGIKWVAGIFYAPTDNCYSRNIGEEKFNIVWCEQKGSNTYYVYDSGYTYSEAMLDNVGTEHTDAHNEYEPSVFFTLNEDALDAEKMFFNILVDGNGLFAMQIDEFIVYRLEGEYGVFAPLREFKESATNHKNDLYVVRQLLKKERYLNYTLPEDMTAEQLLDILEKLEWQLDTKYAEDD